MTRCCRHKHEMCYQCFRRFSRECLYTEQERDTIDTIFAEIDRLRVEDGLPPLRVERDNAHQLAGQLRQQLDDKPDRLNVENAKLRKAINALVLDAELRRLLPEGSYWSTDYVKGANDFIAYYKRAAERLREALAATGTGKE